MNFRNFSKYLLCLILCIAGILHLGNPDLFIPALPAILPFKFELIYITGIFELILGIGLIVQKYQDLSARIIALYFLLLLPIHVYVSLSSIEIFGINNSFLLWARTFFQFFFIFWALSLQTQGWIIEQEWKNVFFIHYKIDPKIIQGLVPFKLDLYDNQAVISIVPFRMEGIRFPFFPVIPSISALWELNIRTYIELNGMKGVYFFTLETDSRMGEFIAKKFFHLPYRYSKIRAAIKEKKYFFNHSREVYSFDLEASILEERIPSKFDLWATERYSLFVKHKEKVFQGIVEHNPWSHKNVTIEKIDNNFTKMISSKKMELSGSSYCEYLKVRFRPFNDIT